VRSIGSQTKCYRHTGPNRNCDPYTVSKLPHAGPQSAIIRALRIRLALPQLDVPQKMERLDLFRLLREFD
jgi:hypothetical protein